MNMKWNKPLYILFVFLLIVLSACQSQEESPPALPEAEATLEPAPDVETAVEITPIEVEETAVPVPEFIIIETLSADIGAEGGTLASSDGMMELNFPPNALPDTRTVTVVLREAVPADGAVLSPIMDITVEPELTESLASPASLIFYDRGEEGVFYGRLTTLLGHIEMPAEDMPDTVSYWQPQEQTRINEDGGLQLWLAGFSTYAILDKLPEACDPVSLTPPSEAADAFAYVGRKLIVNQIVATTWQDLVTTVPPFHPSSSDDQLVVQQQNVEGCANVTAVDIFTPHTPIETPVPQAICNPNFYPWLTPDAPPAHLYYSTDIFFNGTISETIMAENPPPFLEDAIQTITLQNSGQRHGEEACSSSVVHNYIALPHAQSNTLNPDCIPDPELLTPSYSQPGYEYIGHDVFVNGSYISDLSTISIDRPPRPTDIVNPTSSTMTSNGTLVCETYVAHLFAQPEGSPIFANNVQTMQPAVIEGYSYQGYVTAVNGNPITMTSTLPPMPIGDDDIYLYRSSSSSFQNNLPITATVTVDHLYKPQNQGSCVVPPEWLIPPETPACFRYVGVDVVINKVYDEDVSTVPPKRPPRRTDDVHIHSKTIVIDKATKCDIVVEHIFEEISCPPPIIIIPTDVPPHVYVYNHGYGAGAYVEIYFPPDSNLSEADWESLASISIRPPLINENGSRNISLPPGSQVEYTDGKATITIPQN